MNRPALYVGLVLLLALCAFAWYAISPIFMSIEVDEAIPRSSDTGDGEYAPEEPMDESSPAETETDSAPFGAAVVGTTAHPASGSVRIVEADSATYVRYENYKTINGPDIYVYLANDLGAKEFVDLGRVRATEGNINYEVPAGVDINEYRYVLTWCKAFGVLFNYADLSPL